MSKLGYALNQLIKKQRGGSFATRAASKRIFNLIAKELIQNGYKIKSPDQLKPKHIEYLVTKWRQNELSASTIKNRMAELRWLSAQIGKPNIVHRTNDAYSISRRVFVGTNKAHNLDMSKLQNIQDIPTKYSLLLQSHFGLRKAECIHFNAAYAYKEEHIYLKSTWTKGGKARSIPIKTQGQRDLLNEIKAKFGSKSLIADNRNFKEQMKVYEYETCRVGLNRNHGLRHHFAQVRFKEISGYSCPHQGGKSRQEMSKEEKKIDNNFRKQLSQELGHERIQITAMYIGS
ncbi:integrase-like protein [Idiomarina loihiensis]|uniref:phage integrase N-terminal domain-containing protein n=1 Tax=Idiomarina TaxID=135575 RepID=UPI000D70E896|nr:MULTISPECIES: phage integrase N-terminal domain-containing protein [Idiomarina]PWW35224.1 integrase-like protein [Idiomarina loihiensis]TDP45164.1 integrase-like protein [Idiomarina loihiensis]TDS21115.1 integrase-like protein [Idiomarina sp. H2]